MINYFNKIRIRIRHVIILNYEKAEVFSLLELGKNSEKLVRSIHIINECSFIIHIDKTLIKFSLSFGRIVVNVEITFNVIDILNNF